MFATSRRSEAVADLQSEFVTPLRLDVTDEESRAAAVEAVLSQADRIDGLVNNAGYTEIGPLEDATHDQVRTQFETNAFGPLRLAQLVLPTMRSQGSGRIVNVSSIGGRVAIPFIGLYNASKFALEALSDALRVEAKPFGVHVAVIEPGSVRTNFNSTAAHHAYRFSSDTDSAYARFFEGFNRFVSQSSARASSPEQVAGVIHRALTAERPKARYPATPQARLLLAILPWLSDSMRDALWARLMSLPRDGVA